MNTYSFQIDFDNTHIYLCKNDEGIYMPLFMLRTNKYIKLYCTQMEPELDMESFIPIFKLFETIHQNIQSVMFIERYQGKIAFPILYTEACNQKEMLSIINRFTFTYEYSRKWDMWINKRISDLEDDIEEATLMKTDDILKEEVIDANFVDDAVYKLGTFKGPVLVKDGLIIRTKLFIKTIKPDRTKILILKANKDTGFFGINKTLGKYASGITKYLERIFIDDTRFRVKTIIHGYTEIYIGMFIDNEIVDDVLQEVNKYMLSTPIRVYTITKP